MNEYKIVHRESLVGYFYVTAENEKDALDVFHYQVSEGQIDFSDLEMIDSSDEAEVMQDVKMGL